MKQPTLGLKQHKKHKGHGFVRSLIYGPVNSRRYGLSLGVNVLPVDQKVCSFNCVYCQLGWNPKNKKPAHFPPVKVIIAELKSRLPDLIEKKIETIALSGNGEPTLHPGFDKIVTTIIAIRKQCRNKPRVICLTNGTRLANKRVLRTLKKVNECCLKIDANPIKVNLPLVRVDRQGLIQQASQLKNLVVQSCFFDGKIGNADARSVGEWIGVVTRLKPRRIDLYTISRRTPAKGLRAVSSKKLNSIALDLRRCSSVKVQVCL